MPDDARLIRILPLSLAFVLLIACGDDDATGPESTPSTGEMTVVVESQDEVRVDAVQTQEHQVSICYANGGCEGYLEVTGSERSVRGSAGTGNVVVLHASDSDREAVGAIVEFEVEREGTGVAHVIDRRVEDGFGVSMEDVRDDVIESSTPFTGGEVVSLEVGDTE